MTNSEVDLLRRDNQLLEESQSIGKLGGWELDIKSGNLFWTSETYKIHETSPIEFNPTVDAGVSYFLPESKKTIEKALDLAINEGINYDLNLETYTAKGNKINVRTTCIVTKGKNGKPNKLTGIFQDITEQKKLEKIFDSYKYALDQHSIVSITDKTGKITYANEMFSKVSGYSQSELIGANHRLVNSGYHSKKFFEEMYNVILSGKVWKGIKRNKRKDGSFYWVDTTLIPVSDQFGNIEQFFSVRNDITDKKLSEEALVKSQRLAAMGEMAASIAHDFNNSLQAIMSNIELVKIQKTLPTGLKHKFDTIEKIILDIKERVHSLQQFGNPNENKGTDDSTDLNEAIINSIDELKPLWKGSAEREGKVISYTTDLQAKSYIKMVKGELKTILYNLIKNSIEAMRENGEIAVKTYNERNSICLEFSDNGIGISEESGNKIFEPYYSTKGYEQGRGLGLSGVYSIMKNRGGNIEIKKTALNVGTTFLLTFIPCKRDSKFEKKVVIEKSEVNKTILWVEDDAILGLAAEEVVQGLGYKCKWVDGGEEAISELEKGRYDIVVTDIGMAGIDGLQLAKHIKDNFSGVAVAAVSGWDVTETEKIQNGIKASLTKPYSSSKLEEILSLL